MLTKAARLIPQNLLASLRSGSPPVVFLGSGFGNESHPPLHTGGELAERARAVLKISANGETLAEVLQYYKNANGGSHAKLVAWLKSERLYGESVPGGAHHLLLQLPVREFITTNYDTLLLDASKKVEGTTLLSVTDPESFDRSKHPRTSALLAQMHGSFHNERAIVASTDDFIELLQQDQWRQLVESTLHLRTVVFVGYSLRDFSSWTSYMSVLIRYYKSMPPHVLVSPATGMHLQTYWQKYNVQYVPLSAGHFLLGIHDALGTLSTKEDIALAAAAVALAKTLPDAKALVTDIQKSHRYQDITLAALRAIEQADI